MRNGNSFEPTNNFSNMDDSILQSIGESLSEDTGRNRVANRVTAATSEEYSNFRILGIGKETAKQKANKEKRKKKREQIKAKFKKRITKLKDKVGKIGKNFRNKFRSIIRKDILFKIKKNIHGLAVRLYPAVASPSDVASRKYKKSYVAKSKNIYSELLKKWSSLGGNEADLRAAIIEGEKKKRFAKSPYKNADGTNDSYSFYEYFSSADAVVDEAEGVINEAEGVEEVPSQEEKSKGIRGFFAWLKGLFKKNKADNETPYEEGTVEANEFKKDAAEDKGNEPAESEANNDVIGSITDPTAAANDDAGGKTDEAKKEELEDKEADADANKEASATDDKDKKILGMPKTTFWIVTGIVAAAAIGFAVWKMKKK